MRMHDPGPRHEPTPDEIRQACAEIRAEWTPDVERVRRATRNGAVVVDVPKASHWESEK